MKPKPLFEMNLKIVIVGDPSVGKTSLMNRIIKDKFDSNYSTTLGVDFSFKNLLVRNSKIKLQIWDTAGQEKYRSLITSYYKHTDGIIMVFDLTDANSFQNILSSWINHMTTYLHGDFPKLLIIGNKKDLLLTRSIIYTKEDIKRQLEAHELCRMRDLEINEPLMHGDDPANLEFNINGGMLLFIITYDLSF